MRDTLRPAGQGWRTFDSDADRQITAIKATSASELHESKDTQLTTAIVNYCRKTWTYMLHLWTPRPQLHASLTGKCATPCPQKYAVFTILSLVTFARYWRQVFKPRYLIFNFFYFFFKFLTLSRDLRRKNWEKLANRHDTIIIIITITIIHHHHHHHHPSSSSSSSSLQMHKAAVYMQRRHLVHTSKTVKSRRQEGRKRGRKEERKKERKKKKRQTNERMNERKNESVKSLMNEKHSRDMQSHDTTDACP